MCFCCGKNGHIEARCPNASAKLTSIEEDEEMVESVTPANVLFKSVDIRATNVLTAYPTCPPIMTEVKMGGGKVKFECDTAASHNILSQETYQDIWRRGSGSKLVHHNVNVILADGTKSQKKTRSMEAVVETSNNKQSCCSL